MFFGAGNLLLPPYIGLQIGTHIWTTILAFGLSGILLPFTGVLAVTNSGENFNDLGHRVNKTLAVVLGTVIMICIGPLIAIPRTAATTFEVGILPTFPQSSPRWTSLIFFIAVWCFAIVPRKVVDIVGTILTPLLLIILTFLIIKGIVSPIAPPVTESLTTGQSFTLGFTEGYQTLDVLASVVFAGIIIASAKAKGYTSLKEKNKVVIAAGILAASCLLFIYGGLIYLGASSGVESVTISRSELLLSISHRIFGTYGTLAINVCITLACLTTAIALTSAVGTYFSGITNGRLGYKLLVTLCCLLSGVLSVIGVDNIIKFAYPPLAFVYPIVITLVLYIVIFGHWVKSKGPYIAAISASTIVAAINLLKILGLLEESQLTILNKIPLFKYELGWVLPSILFFGVALLINRQNGKLAGRESHNG